MQTKEEKAAYRKQWKLAHPANIQRHQLTRAGRRAGILPEFKHKSSFKRQNPLDYKRPKRKKPALPQSGVLTSGQKRLFLEKIETARLSQNGLCAICKKPKPLVIDHCHEKIIFRGLLCDLCNRGIGFFKDNPDTLRSAAEYVEKFKNYPAESPQ